jgi:hypothetical protein
LFFKRASGPRSERIPAVGSVDLRRFTESDLILAMPSALLCHLEGRTALIAGPSGALAGVFAMRLARGSAVLDPTDVAGEIRTRVAHQIHLVEPAS